MIKRFCLWIINQLPCLLSIHLRAYLCALNFYTCPYLLSAQNSEISNLIHSSSCAVSACLSYYSLIMQSNSEGTLELLLNTWVSNQTCSGCLFLSPVVTLLASSAVSLFPSEEVCRLMRNRILKRHKIWNMLFILVFFDFLVCYFTGFLFPSILTDSL